MTSSNVKSLDLTLSLPVLLLRVFRITAVVAAVSAATLVVADVSPAINAVATAL